jgi:hypothetical protein
VVKGLPCLCDPGFLTKGSADALVNLLDPKKT